MVEKWINCPQILIMWKCGKLPIVQKRVLRLWKTNKSVNSHTKQM